jgi:hypothetical protein
MAGEESVAKKLVQKDPGLGARVLLRAYEGGGDVAGAWDALVDWGADKDESKALEILARETSGMEEAMEIIGSIKTI